MSGNRSAPVVSGQMQPRFAADNMLLKLGRYLRILGYDVLYNPRLRTHELIRLSNREDRIFLTRNKHLPHQYPAPRHSLFVAPENPVEQLRFVMQELGLTSDNAFSRCILCNEPLEPADRTAAAGKVPEDILQRQSELYHCPRCGRFYWAGSHVRNTARRLGLSLE